MSAGSSSLLDADALAERWGVPRSHIYRLARGHQIPVVQIGRYKRFRVADIEAFEQAGGTSGPERTT